MIVPVRVYPYVLLGACSFSPHAAGDGGTTGDDASDARIDAAIDAPARFDGPPGLCFGSGSFTVCLPSLPSTPVSVGPATIDTTACNTAGAHVVDQPTGSLCVFAGTTASVGGGVFATGSRP